MPREKKSSTTKSRSSKRNTTEIPLPGSKEDRQAKLELFLKDFDLQTENHLKAMRAREKEGLAKLEQEWALYTLKIPPQVMNMKMSEFMDKYKGDVSYYERQFASADDSIDDLPEADFNPKKTDSRGKVDDKKQQAGDKRRSDEENEVSDVLAPLPKTSSVKPDPTSFETPGPSKGRQPLVSFTPSQTRPPRRSEIDNPIHSKLVLYQESKKGSPLSQDLEDMGTPELKRIQAQIDRMMKLKQKQQW